MNHKSSDPFRRLPWQTIISLTSGLVLVLFFALIGVSGQPSADTAKTMGKAAPVWLADFGDEININAASLEDSISNISQSGDLDGIEDLMIDARAIADYSSALLNANSNVRVPYGFAEAEARTAKVYFAASKAHINMIGGDGNGLVAASYYQAGDKHLKTAKQLLNKSKGLAAANISSWLAIFGQPKEVVAANSACKGISKYSCDILWQIQDINDFFAAGKITDVQRATQIGDILKGVVTDASNYSSGRDPNNPLNQRAAVALNDILKWARGSFNPKTTGAPDVDKGIDKMNTEQKKKHTDRKQAIQQWVTGDLLALRTVQDQYWKDKNKSKPAAQPAVSPAASTSTTISATTTAVTMPATVSTATIEVKKAETAETDTKKTADVAKVDVAPAPASTPVAKTPVDNTPVIPSSAVSEFCDDETTAVKVYPAPAGSAALGHIGEGKFYKAFRLATCKIDGWTKQSTAYMTVKNFASNYANEKGRSVGVKIDGLKSVLATQKSLWSLDEVRDTAFETYLHTSTTPQNFPICAYVDKPFYKEKAFSFPFTFYSKEEKTTPPTISFVPNAPVSWDGMEGTLRVDLLKIPTTAASQPSTQKTSTGNTITVKDALNPTAVIGKLLDRAKDKLDKKDTPAVATETIKSDTLIALVPYKIYMDKGIMKAEIGGSGGSQKPNVTPSDVPGAGEDKNAFIARMQKVVTTYGLNVNSVSSALPQELTLSQQGDSLIWSTASGKPLVATIEAMSIPGVNGNVSFFAGTQKPTVAINVSVTVQPHRVPKAGENIPVNVTGSATVTIPALSQQATILKYAPILTENKTLPISDSATTGSVFSSDIECTKK